MGVQISSSTFVSVFIVVQPLLGCPAVACLGGGGSVSGLPDALQQTSLCPCRPSFPERPGSALGAAASWFEREGWDVCLSFLRAG